MNKDKEAILQENNTLEAISKKVNFLIEELSTERKKRERALLTRNIVVWISLFLLVIYGAVFYKMYKYYTWPQFVESLQLKAVEMLPQATKELSTAAEKSAPIVFEKLKDSAIKSLPDVSNQLQKEYEKLLNSAIEDSKVKLNELVYSQVDEILKRAWVTATQVTNWKTMTQEQFDELKNWMIKDLTNSAEKIMNDSMKKQLDQYTYTVWKLTESVEKIAKISPEDKDKFVKTTLTSVLDVTTDQLVPMVYNKFQKSALESLPIVSNEIRQEYSKSLKLATDETKVRLNDLVYTQVDEILKRAGVTAQNATNWKIMSQDQFNELKNWMIKDITTTADKLLTEWMQTQLNQCTKGVENLSNTVLKIKEIPEWDRRKAAYDITIWILDALYSQESDIVLPTE